MGHPVLFESELPAVPKKGLILFAVFFHTGISLWSLLPRFKRLLIEGFLKRETLFRTVNVQTGHLGTGKFCQSMYWERGLEMLSMLHVQICLVQSLFWPGTHSLNRETHAKK